MTRGLREFSERICDGVRAGAPSVLNSGEGEELIHTQPGVSLVLANRPPLSPGTLYISNRKVVWLSDVDRAQGYAVDFLSVSLHAVSRDPEAYTFPCIYTQIDTGAEDESDGSDSDSSEIPDLSKITEMRLVPSDPNQVNTLFELFCRCAELNPEPVEDTEEAEEHNWITSTDQMMDADDSDWPDLEIPTAIGHSNGDLSHSVLELQINDERFEDAEETEGDIDRNHN